MCLSQLSGFGGGSSLLGNSMGTSGSAMSKSWSTTGFGGSAAAPPPSGGVAIQLQGWAIKPMDMRKYVMDFNNIDVSKSGFLSGELLSGKGSL